MCPDRQIISLYHDEELPSPWKEKLESHLESCTECRAALAGYRELGVSLKCLSDETIQAARERVWTKLSSGEAAMPENLPVRRVWKAKRIWSRTVTLPLPAAAAAAAAILIAVLFISLTGIRGETRSQRQDSIAATNMGLDDYGMVPVHDMNDVLRYLSSQDNGDFMVIRLPESTRFSRSGEPALINAADYSRNNPRNSPRNNSRRSSSR